ncbi:MAG: hypothetical protein ABIG93_03345 [archaeon]|nr:hypothetical protein [Nanoarchaeota archaeon]
MKLNQIIENLMQKGGWELYHHACGRPDLNDTGDESCYVRAFYNVANPITNGNNLKSFLGVFAEADYGLSGTDKDDNEIVMYGRFPTKRSLAELIERTDDSAPYFVRLEIKASVPDNFGRRGATPSLTIVADQSSILSLVEYLKENPNDYYEAIGMLVPNESYPNVNKGILQEVKPASEIMFLDMDQVVANMENDLPKWEDVVAKNREAWDKLRGFAQLEVVSAAREKVCPTSEYSKSPAVRERYGVVVNR